jgi:hypothetical protein
VLSKHLSQFRVYVALLTGRTASQGKMSIIYKILFFYLYALICHVGEQVAQIIKSLRLLGIIKINVIWPS